MKAVTAIVAEDEAPQRAELVALLGDLWPDLDIVAQCSDGAQALESVRAHRPAVAFLDIRMPGASGFEVARALDARTHVVFVTAYDSFAVQAFEDGAVDYLLKPVRPERLRATIARVSQRLEAGGPVDLGEVLNRIEARMAPPAQRIRWITASVAGVVRMTPIEEVLFFQSEDKYTRVVSASDEAHIRTPLKELLAQLDPDEFWQVHRGCVVRVSAIRAVRRDDDGKLRLQVAGRVEQLPVSPAFAGRFRSM